MKKKISILLTAVLLFTYVFAGMTSVSASAKTNESRAIAIVFDNSGSMYDDGDQAWCRATYAMEVFASMLNAGDALQIYPMWEITANGQTYTMEKPLQITDSSQASMIRDIYTEDPKGTPIESIDCAISGLKSISADKKYMIVLTDGGTFYENGKDLKGKTEQELDKRIQSNAGNSMTIMYLGIGSDACVPKTKESEYFLKRHAENTADVLSMLTEMCNRIFGRDTLPKSRISGNTIEFDISMRKLIVFVQGESISNLKLTGGSAGRLVSSQQTKYSTKGNGKYESVPDTSLQGMLVTYTDCLAGEYTLEYSGTARSIEVYYEPDADLEFVFTDANGNEVDPKELYEGEYKVSYGMKDAKTGKLADSDLLGETRYEGFCYIDGQEVPIQSSDKKNGSVSFPLKIGQEFKASLTVTYLSGYTITKTNKDFGWPDPIVVIPIPAGDLKVEISGGEESYSLQKLEEGAPFIVKVFYMGEQLTGGELESVAFEWDKEKSIAEITKEFAEDHWEMLLHYKDPNAPQNTVCDQCSVPIKATYCAQGSDESQATGLLAYTIADDYSPLEVQLRIPNDYIVIKELQASKPITVELKLNGQPLDAESFDNVELVVDCGGINYEKTANKEDSSYSVKLLPTDGITADQYEIKVTAIFTDSIGRESKAEASDSVTLSNIPMWVRWAIGLLILLLAVIIIWMILHIKVLPKHLHTTKKNCYMNFDGDDVTQSSSFQAEIKKKNLKVQGKYGGKKFGVTMDVKPGKESYLYKRQTGKSAEVQIKTVRKFGNAKIQEALIGSVKYIADDAGKLVPAIQNQKPFELRNGVMVKYSGTIQDAGVEKDFEVTSKLNFKKKK